MTPTIFPHTPRSAASALRTSRTPRTAAPTLHPVRHTTSSTPRTLRRPMLTLALFLLTGVFAAAIPTSASAQVLRRSELSLSYGLIPATNWIDSYTGLLNAHYADSSFNLSGWGAVTAGYSFRFTKKFSLGLQCVYSSNKESYNTLGVTVHNRYWGLMPNIKWNWVNLRVVSFYSRVGAGLSFTKSKGDDVSLTQTQFAFQASALGVETTGRLAFYAEAGLGQSGSIVLGGRWRF